MSDDLDEEVDEQAQEILNRVERIVVDSGSYSKDEVRAILQLVIDGLEDMLGEV